jgi:chromosome segregation ATPase
MDAKPFWDFVSSISFGTVVAWTLGISAIITALCTGTIKLYKLFTKYKEAKDREQEQEDIIKSHDTTLQDIDKTLREIKVSLEEQKEVNLKQIRHTIVHTCEDALDKGEISINKLRSLEEMYDEYVKIFHGNGYVKTLVMRVRKLKIVGKLDD